MIPRNQHDLALLLACLLLGSWQEAPAQQVAPESAAPAPVAAPPPTAWNAATKEEILASECWRRAMFELNTWFRSQTIYTPEEVARLRSEFAERVDTMSIEELRDVISDMDAKFQILDSPQVREVRDWFGHYISILSDRRREEILRDIPNFAKMTPGQLTQEIMRFQRKKSSQKSFDRTRQARVDARVQAGRNAQAAAQNRPSRPSSYRSPYRPAQRERPFENVQVGVRRSMTIAPTGEIMMNLGF